MAKPYWTIANDTTREMIYVGKYDCETITNLDLEDMVWHGNHNLASAVEQFIARVGDVMVYNSWDHPNNPAWRYICLYSQPEQWNDPGEPVLTPHVYCECHACNPEYEPIEPLTGDEPYVCGGPTEVTTPLGNTVTLWLVG